MIKYYAHRRSYVRLRSRHSRYGLGYHQSMALYRFDEYGPNYKHSRHCLGSRFRERAFETPYWRKFLRETDPSVFYHSPRIPRPHYDPNHFLPGR
jgi:hypothetical protein